MLSRNIFKASQLLSLARFSSAKFSSETTPLSGTGPAYDESIRTPIAQRPGISQPRRVTLVQGVGVGPEVTRAVQRIFEAAHAPIVWDVMDNFVLTNTSCNERLRQNEAILLGPLPNKQDGKYLDSSDIYKDLKLYANLTYGRTLPNVGTRHQKVDVVVLRENTEGEYSGVEHEVYPGVIESIKVITKEASKRIAEYAFEFAYLSGRKKVTAVHKANIMKICDGMFLEATREVANRYPFIKYEEMIIDNCCMQIVKNPWQFDVMVMPNLYGSIVSNAVAGICGGPGMTCGANIGKNQVIFEQATRHTGKDLAGKNLANPTGLILSSIIMLKHLGLSKFAFDIEKALDKTYREGKVRTIDVGGTSTTEQFTDEIMRNLEKTR
jgi:isocitrate dehydrogenase (NAD+)